MPFFVVIIRSSSKMLRRKNMLKVKKMLRIQKGDVDKREREREIDRERDR